MKFWLRLAALAATALLAGCGFQLRGETPLPFNSLYVGIPENTRFGSDLRRAITASSPNTVLVAAPKDAEAQLLQITNSRALREVSLDAQGRVEEYELSIVFTFRLINDKGLGLLPDTTLTATREVPYNDQIVQAKQGEFDTTFNTMQQSLIERIVRRLTAPEVRASMIKSRNPQSAAQLPVYGAAPPQGRGTLPQSPSPLTAPNPDMH